MPFEAETGQKLELCEVNGAVHVRGCLCLAKGDKNGGRLNVPTNCRETHF